MATMAKLDRYRGHFYNWYDTETLRALDPQYVSSVDSGNLAGHLIALANTCQSWREAPLAAEIPALRAPTTSTAGAPMTGRSRAGSRQVSGTREDASFRP